MRFGSLLKWYLIMPTYNWKLLLWEVKTLAVFLLTPVPHKLAISLLVLWKDINSFFYKKERRREKERKRHEKEKEINSLYFYCCTFHFLFILTFLDWFVSFVFMNALSEHVYMYHVPAWCPKRLKEGFGFPGIISCHMDARNWIYVLCKSNNWS